MITIKPGSHIHTILTILTLVGEFPMASLGLLGSVRSYGDLIRKLTTVQDFRLPDSKEHIQCRLLTVSGKGKRKTLRFFRGGLPLVERWDNERYQLYLREYRDHSFSGNGSYIERNHLIAEAAVMMGSGYDAALSLLKELKETKGLSLGLFEIYRDIFFIPMNDFGSRLLRILTTQNWRERILRALFKREERSFDMGSFTYDACVDGVYTLSFLDSNLWRLFRFREAVLEDPSLKCRIICFPEQMAFLKSYLGNRVSYATVSVEQVGKSLRIQAVNYLGG